MQRRAWLHLMALTPLALPWITGCDQVRGLMSGNEDDKGDEGEGEGKAKGGGKKAKAQDGVIPAPEPGDVPSLKVGAWSTYEMGNGGKATWAIVERRKDTEYLVDVKIDGPVSMLIQSWVHVPDLRDLKGIKMKDAKYKMGGGPVRKLVMGPTSPGAIIFEKMLSAVTAQKLEGLPQEDVKVEAGLFKGCYKWNNETKFMGIKVEETIWTHPAVPLPAMVKSEPKDGKGGFELLAYGTEGAKKSF